MSKYEYDRVIKSSLEYNIEKLKHMAGTVFVPRIFTYYKCLFVNIWACIETEEMYVTYMHLYDLLL